jgi:hypothetical protein
MCFAVLLVRAFMQEFARISQAIIHGAAQSEKLPSDNQNSGLKQRVSFVAGSHSHPVKISATRIHTRFSKCVKWFSPY